MIRSDGAPGGSGSAEAGGESGSDGTDGGRGGLGWARGVGAALRAHPVTVFFGCAYGLSVAGALWWRAPLWVGLVTVFGVGLLSLLALLREWSAHRPDRRQAALLLAVGAVLWLLSASAVRGGWPWALAHPVNTAALLLFTITLGNWLAAELQRPGHLLPVGVIGALADLWSITGGPTRRISEKTVEHVQTASEHLARGEAPPPPPWPVFLILQWPQPGAGGMAALLGFGDLVFMALLLAAARRFALPGWRALGLVTAGLLASLALSVALRRPVPALPAICGLFLLGNLRALRLERHEWLITGVAAVALGAAVAFAMAQP